MMTQSHLSTISVTREVADQVKKLAQQTNMTHLETATQLLKYALNSGEVTFEREVFSVVPKNLLGEEGKSQPPKRRPRRRK